MSIRRCNRCIMDNSADPFIVFDENGICNYCTDALKLKDRIYFPKDNGVRLKALVDKIKAEGKNKKFDCIMGISGGLDSSYLAMIGYKFGLRVLAIHIDDGYDTDVSRNNIKKLINTTGFDYKVITPDAEQFNALTLAFMKAGVPNLAMPQDDILFAFLYEQMSKNNIKYFLSGGNFALECILQKGNTHQYTDVTNIKDIHSRYGKKPIDNLRFISTTEKLIGRKLKGYKTVQPLDLLDYNRDRAFKELNDFCGFEYYGRKHLENILTAFIQVYWLPQKFGVDKRTSHLSSMIASDQMTREEALKELSEAIYDEEQMKEFIDIIKKNLCISDAEFDSIMRAPVHQHTDYKVEDKTIHMKIIHAIQGARK